MAEQVPIERQRRLVGGIEKGLRGLHDVCAETIVKEAYLRSLAHGLDAGRLVRNRIGSEADLDEALPE
jgi:hypothetical protein